MYTHEWFEALEREIESKMPFDLEGEYDSKGVNQP